MKKKKILLHTCCAPCIAYVQQLLSQDSDITAYFFNPNISPKNEYRKRLDELERFSRKEGLELIVGEYDPRPWTIAVREYRFLGERSRRCEVCIRFRLRKTFETASQGGFDSVASTLTISPHKDAPMINSLGSILEEEFGIEFLQSDFKKRDGYRKSVEMSRDLGFYRQNYCGCIYSKMERDRNSAWIRKTALKRSQES